MFRSTVLPLALVLSALATPVWADSTRVGDLVISDAWSRATPEAAAVGAGYLVIENHGATEDRLIAGEADFAGRVEIHEMAMQDGIMRMREIEGGLAVPVGGAVTLEPGGLHIMFMQLQEPLREGEVRTVTLRFANAGEVVVTFMVQGLAARGKSHQGAH